jgi:hypothetical protein
MKLVIAGWLICYFGVLMALYIRFELTHSKLSPGIGHPRSLGASRNLLMRYGEFEE